MTFLVIAMVVLGLTYLLVHRLREWFGLSLLYFLIGSNQLVQVLLVSTAYVELSGGFRVFPGSAVFFTAGLFAVLLVYATEDILTTRKLIYGIILVNIELGLVMVAAAAGLATGRLHATGWIEAWLQAFNLRAHVTGTGILIVDVFLLIIIYETLHARLLRLPRAVRPTLAMALVLAFDTVVYIGIGFAGEPGAAGAMVGNLIGKSAAALVYGMLLAAYLGWREGHVPATEPREIRDLFSIFTYREQLRELEEEKGTLLHAKVEAEAEVHRTLKRLEALHQLDGAIIEARSVAEIADAALTRLYALVPADRWSLAVFDEAAGTAEVFAKGALEDALGHFEPVPIEHAFADPEALRTGRPVRIDDLAELVDPSPFLAGLAAHGLHSAINLPIRARGELLGSLNAARASAVGFSDADVDVAREVADSLAIAIEQARIHEALANHTHELESRVAERTAELAARTAEAERLNRAMLNLLDDLREEQRQTREVAYRLELSNRELESFAYSVSHDLRAPLRAIDGFGEALFEELSGSLDERQRDYLDRMRAAARRLGVMIDGLLALSRASRAEMGVGKVDLSKLAAEVVAELRADDPERRVDVSVANDMIVRGDERLLRLVLQNLIGNAWKFTAPREEAVIEVGRRNDGDESVFYVQDNGVGFDMKYVDKLFGAFQRLHRRDEFAGDGIGLATVQRIVARHGGRVWAEATPDVGAAFFFTLR